LIELIWWHGPPPQRADDADPHRHNQRGRRTRVSQHLARVYTMPSSARASPITLWISAGSSALAASRAPCRWTWRPG